MYIQRPFTPPSHEIQPDPKYLRIRSPKLEDDDEYADIEKGIKNPDTNVNQQRIEGVLNAFLLILVLVFILIFIIRLIIKLISLVI